MADSSPTLWQFVATALVSLLTGGGLKYLIDRQRAPSESRLLDRQADSEGVKSLEARIGVAVKIVDFYEETSDDMAERIRQLKRELRLMTKERDDLRQANAILRDMRGIKLPEKQGE